MLARQLTALSSIEPSMSWTYVQAADSAVTYSCDRWLKHNAVADHQGCCYITGPVSLDHAFIDDAVCLYTQQET